MSDPAWYMTGVEEALVVAGGLGASRVCLPVVATGEGGKQGAKGQVLEPPELDRFAEDAWYLGRPLLMTQNDYSLRLYNGDMGVIVARDAGRKTAIFERQGGLVEISPTRLDAVDTVHALTIHKSQGSQIDTVAVLLPDPRSRILTRELLYTAVTRARKSMIVCGTEAAIRAALERPVAQASGLAQRLWG